MQIDPRHLIQFATIIEEGSFSEAAAKLSTTQPALSNMVKNLEIRTGLKLLSQRRRPVIATKIGQEFVIKGQGIRSLLEELHRETKESRAGETGTIRVSAPSFFCEYVLADLISSFRRKTPKASFDIRTGYNLELHQMVDKREVDMAFGPIVPNIDGIKIQSRAFVSFKHEIVCRSGHPILKKRKVIVDDLKEVDWLSHSRESALFQIMQVELARLGIYSLGNALKSSSASAVMQLLQNTDCVSILPVFSVLPSLREGKLAIVKFQHELPEVRFGMITQRHYSPSPLEIAFIDHVEEGLQEINRILANFGT